MQQQLGKEDAVVGVVILEVEQVVGPTGSRDGVVRSIVSLSPLLTTRASPGAARLAALQFVGAKRMLTHRKSEAKRGYVERNALR